MQEIYPTNIEKAFWILQEIKQNKTRLDALKTASNKLVQKSAEATDKFIENTIADKTVTTKSMPKANSRNVKEIVIPPEQRKKMINELRQVS